MIIFIKNFFIKLPGTVYSVHINFPGQNIKPSLAPPVKSFCATTIIILTLPQIKYFIKSYAINSKFSFSSPSSKFNSVILPVFNNHYKLKSTALPAAIFS